jgi:hypothetical protein
VTLSSTLAAFDLLSGPVRGDEVAALLATVGVRTSVERVVGDRGATDFITATVPGTRGAGDGGEAPTLGVVGRLGGVGARPDTVGLVSDGDGAVTAVAALLELGRMATRGDRLPGDVIVATHVCPDAPTEPHEPVPFMGSPVPMEVMNRMEVRPEMDAVLTVDTTKGNRILNWRGVAITPTVMQGWVLPVAPDLVEVCEQVTGAPARVLPITTYDITPYGNGLWHVNSIVQPAVATDAPVVGVALTTETVVPGSATGASHPTDIAMAVSFCLEVAKRFGAGRLRFFDTEEFGRAVDRYGPMRGLQTMGRGGDVA